MPSFIQRILTIHKNRDYTKEHPHINISTQQLYKPSRITTHGFKNKSGSIVIASLSSVEALQREKGSLQKCVLNFADPYVPGGGYLVGLNTQEESLCYCSNLHRQLAQKECKNFYWYNRLRPLQKLYSDYAIYTSNVTFFRNPITYMEIEPQYADVLTIPAPQASSYKMIHPFRKHELIDCLQRRIRKIYEIAAENDVDVLILGAWGCGAFGNDPYLVANLFYSSAKEFNQLKRSYSLFLVMVIIIKRLSMSTKNNINKQNRCAQKSILTSYLSYYY